LALVAVKVGPPALALGLADGSLVLLQKPQ
jgi:hypothetical protein